MILLYSVCCILILSTFLNIFLLYKLKKPKTHPKLDADAKALLRDLMNSGAMLNIRVLDPSDFFLKSPRSK